MTTSVSEFLVQASASLAGALAGALAAFQLEAWREKRKQRVIRIEKLNKTIFALGQNRNYVLNLKVQHLDPNRDKRNRAFLPPVLEIPNLLPIEWTELTFLLSVPDGGQLLNRLAGAEQVFAALLRTASNRAGVHFSFQERLAASQAARDPGLPPLNPEDLAQIRQAVGPPLFVQLTDLTNQLYETADHALNANRAAYAELTAAFQAIFPRAKHIRLEEAAPAR